MQGSPMPAEGISPLEVNPGKLSASSPTVEGLISQIDNTQGQMKKVEQSLNFAQLKLKKAQERLVDDKLQAASSDIQGAAKAAGAPLVPTTIENGMPPVAKFLSYVGDSQNQLTEVKSTLSSMAKKGPMNPADMLLIQVKLAQAQQEVEFSSALLSKVVESIKQTLNIQIQ